MTEVLVTGATGFVGPHVIRSLQGRVGRIRALVRPTSDIRQLRELDVEPCVASLADPAALREAVGSAGVVVHLAALTHARTEAELQAVNAEGTAALLAAMAAAGTAARFVYLSSLAAAGPSLDGVPVGPDTAPQPLTAYGRSKLGGEVAVRQADGAIEGVILRAPAVYGPGDRELLRFFRLAKLGVLPVPAGGARPLQMVHVRDLARAIADAVAVPAPAGLFHIADAQAFAFNDLCRMVGDAVGTRPLLLPVPGGAIAMAAAVSELSARITRRSTMFNREKVRELLAPGWLCETERARSAFGFTTEIPLPQGLRETAEWYRIHGWL